MSEKIKAFIKAHPIFSYLALSTITGKICKMIVNVVRAFTGKYPPSTTTLHIPELEKVQLNVKNAVGETTETETPIEEKGPFESVYDSIKADEENSEVEG